MVTLRDGAFADFEPQGRIYAVRQVGAANVFQVGRWRYDDWGRPLTPGAPAIHIICDFRGTTKHGNKAVMRDFERRLAIQIGADREARRAPPAGDHRRIDTLPRTAFLRISCKHCSRTRFEQVGFVVSEARLGTRTIAEYEGFASCGRPNCRGKQAVLVEM